MKRISTILTLLMLMCMGAWATESTITVCTNSDAWSDHGTWTAQTSSNWGTTWKSTNGDVSITSQATGYIYKGGTPNAMATTTYTLTGSKGKLVTGYSVTFYVRSNGSTATFTAADGTTMASTSSTIATETATLSQNNLTGGSTTITVSGTWANITEFTITLKDDPWFPSLGEKYISVGEKVANFTPVTEGSDNRHWYILTQTRGGETSMYDSGLGNKLMRHASVTATSLNAQKVADYAAYLIRFVSVGEGTYNIQFADGNWINNELKTVSSKSDAGTYAFYNCNGGTGSYFAWNLNSKTGSIVDNNGPGGYVTFYSSGTVNATSGNNVWYLYPVTMSDVAYTITYKLPNTIQEEVQVSHFSGDDLSAPAAWVRDGVTFSYYSSYDNGEFSNSVTKVTGDATVFVKYEYSLSNILSASTSTSDLRWYRLAASSNNAYYDLYYNGSAPYPYKAQSAFDGSDGYFWAFVGNPIDGVKVYNKALATSKTMIHNDNTNPVMDTDDETKWFIRLYDGMIGFQYSSNTGHCWNDHGGGAATLKYFGNPSYHQYTFIDDVDFNVLYTNNIKPFINYPGEGYFKISSTDAATLSGEYNNANNDSKITLSEYASLANSLNNKISWPATGYYRIKSNSASTYLKAENASQLTVGGTGNEASSIVYLNGSTGTYTMQMQGQYVKAQANSYPVILQSGSINVYLTIPTVSSVVSPGKVAIGNGLTATDYLRVNDTNVVGLSMGSSISDQPTAYWTVEDANSFTITLNSDRATTPTYYATTYLPFDVTISGANAFTLKREGSNLEPTQLTDNKVPAGKAVLLQGTTTAATATINTGDSFSTSNENDLSGSYVQTDFALALTNGATAEYFLGVDDNGKVGFYHSGVESKTESETRYYTLAANRAYLSNGSSARGYAINWSDASSVQDMKAAEDVNSAVVYDLQGRRVENPQHGMYIRNGRVIVVK